MANKNNLNNDKKIRNKITYEDVAKAMENGFKENFKAKLIKDGLTKEELRLAKKLERNKYSIDRWNFEI